MVESKAWSEIGEKCASSVHVALNRLTRNTIKRGAQIMISRTA
jgi:hypothetical protein